MKPLYPLVLLFAIAFLLPEAVHAQRPNEFSADRTAFIGELQEYMTSSRRKAVEEVYTEFETVVKGGLFDEEEMEQIRTMGNLMLEKRMNPSPYFQIYLKGLTMIKKDEQSNQKFDDWHQVLQDILTKSEGKVNKRFADFIRFSNQFFETKALKSSENSTTWFTIADDYKIEFIENQPIFSFDGLDLMAYSKKDTIFIYETEGSFYPLDLVWKGKGGKVNWEERYDMEAYAVLSDYELDVKRSLYEADNVTLYYPLYFGAEGIRGNFQDKLITPNSAVGGTYPRFESYDRILKIDNFGKGVEYVGGFRLNGELVYGLGDSEQRSSIQIFNEQGDLVFRGTAESFTIRREERIVGEQVESTFYFGQDSLYHPSVNIRYNIPKRAIALSRGNRGSDRNPFFSSLHQVNIDAETINAFVDRDSIIIGRKSINLAKNTDVFFESLKYYAELDYRRVQNIANVNPIAIMKITADQEGTNFIDANLIARRINGNFTVDNIQSLIYDLTSKGFINYDSDKQIIEIKDKVFHYANASQEQVDYDLIKIKSKTDDANAVLNLDNQTIDISGITSLEFSPVQRVGLVPDSNSITLEANRNMNFSGRVFAGYATLEGSDYYFDYDKFQIQMDSVAHFDLFVRTGELDQNNRQVAMSIGSRIEDLSGVLLIDAPSNKSGKDTIKMFPSFQSKTHSYVYYDSDSTLAGAYDRDSFYFEVKPFSFNHLDDFGPEDIRFKGTLHSSNIFPEFDEELRLQKHDQSLGFETETPEELYPNYDGKGSYTGKINLSNSGLQGNGNLQYLGASINSEDIVFKPKQLLASAEKFDLEENEEAEVQVPQVRGVDVKIDWRPYKDSMYVSSDIAPFALFKEDNHTLDGTLILTPGGLKGDGLLDWDKASMRSKLFSFGTFSADADTTDVRIKTFDAQDLALQTSNVLGQVDFVKEVGYFKANDAKVRTKLPYNKYETSMNEFDWDMAGETITFKSEKNKLGEFLSVHEDQDSLVFDGETAIYNLRSSELDIGGVPYIVAGDAFVYPDSGKVQLQPGGVMATLENAQIIADTLNRYHVINKAVVNILGKKLYKASGFYEYNIGDREQEIALTDIVSQRTGKGPIKERLVITKATGNVTPEDNFYIDHKTEFRGTISLTADSKNLKFDGFARLDADKLPEKHWFSIHSKGDKKDLAIEFDEPKSYNGAALKTGLFLSKGTSRIYPSVMGPLPYRKDRDILQAKGVFKYDEAVDQFIFGDSSKVIREELKGNLLVFKNQTGEIEAEGRFNIGSGFKDFIQIDAAGTAKATFPEKAPETEEEKNSDIILLEEIDTSMMSISMEPEVDLNPVTAEMMAGIKISAIPEPLLKIMSNDFQASSFDAQNIVYLTDLNYYRKVATEIFPANKDMQEVINAMSTGFLDIPKKYNPYTFLFSQLKMKWHPELQSFISTSNKTGLISINGESIGKMITCSIEFKMPSNEDDRLYIHLKSPNELYYYFGFKGGILSIVSNNPRFMEEFEKLKAKDLVVKMPNGEPFEIQAIEPARSNHFLRRIQSANQ